MSSRDRVAPRESAGDGLCDCADNLSGLASAFEVERKLTLSRTSIAPVAIFESRPVESWFDELVGTDG